MASLISAVSWVARGVSAQQPTKYVLDDEELQRVSALARIDVEDARKELERAHEAARQMGKGTEGDDGDDGEWIDEDDEGGTPVPEDSAADDSMDVDEPAVPVEKKDKDDLSAYNLDDYDNDIEVTNGPFTNIKGLTYYKDNNDDPYITLKDGETADDDERDELQVLPTDNLLVAAKTEDEISQLEIYVYDALNENLYVHHDLMLPNFPLCLEWLDFPPSQSQSQSQSGPSRTHGNYIAVGTLDPEIEIWSLDTLDALYPDALLGRPDATKAHVPVPAGTGKKKKKKTKHRTTSPYYHVDAVLSLSWNKHQRNLLASASADRTVKLWDLNRGTGNANGAISVGADSDGSGDSGNGAIRSFDALHSDKIQSVAWNPSPSSPSILLTASYDRTILTLDTRAPASSVGALLGADPEAIRWDPFEPESFFVSLENGLVLNFDARMLVTNPRTNTETARARWTLAAHDGAVSGLDVNPHIRGCLATGGTDKLVKVWNVAEQGDSEKRNVSLVTSRELGVGKVFSVGWCPDEPLTLSAAGSKAKMQIWDVAANGGARKAFAGKLKEAGRVLRERAQGEDGEGGGGGVVGAVSDGEDSEDDDDE